MHKKYVKINPDINFSNLSEKPFCLAEAKEGKKIMLDISEGKLEAFYVEDCEFCGAENSFCDCEGAA